MARVLGYGGLANTNGARDFSGKAEREAVTDTEDKLIRLASEFIIEDFADDFVSAVVRVYNSVRVRVFA